MKGPKTYCFGTGREQFNKTVVNRENAGSDGIRTNSNPGPSHYEPAKPLGHEAVKFKLKDRLDYHDVARLAIKNGYPGVGTYEDVLAFDKVGKYTSSQFSNSKASNWSKA